MGKSFYLKLALNNLRRNSKKIIPYFIAVTIMVSVYFMVLMILHSKSLANVPESMYIQQLFGIGLYTLNIFIAVFMLYINNFLIKQRKKEFGLYGILGLEKRHVGFVMFWENLIINGAGLSLGIITGCVFGWLIFMALLKSIRVSVDTYFSIPIQSFTVTALYFFGLFLVTSVLNIIQVRMANPIDLLKSDHTGEKKTRFVLPITLVGLAMLGYAYYVAWTVTNPLQALTKFFLAVILVIFASYILFTTGSIALLRILKKNKLLYYKPENFISIAGMIHRMKQNASGLASICILSTMVLVTVSTCFALFLGQEETLSYMSRNDIQVEFVNVTTQEQNDALDQIITEAVDKDKIELTEEYRYYSVDGMLVLKDNSLICPEVNFDYFADTVPDYLLVSFLTAEDYNRLTENKAELKEGELIMLTNKGEHENIRDITLGGITDAKTYEVTSYVSDTVFTKGKNRKAKDEICFVVKDMKELEQLVQRINPTYVESRTTKTILNIVEGQKECYEFSYRVKEAAKSLEGYLTLDSIYINRADCYSMYGGLLFMGAFFTVIFLCATVLIIYFKQISEGYEDKDRFEMLQKVGMDDIEVKKTINQQILIVFFLPLLGALLHLSMASNMIIKLLEVFSMFNVKLTVMCMLGASAIFAAVYVFVYRLTAKTYVKIVQW